MAPLVMVIEDEEALGLLLKYNLEKEGYEVILETRGNKALAEIEKYGPSVILLDWMLPEISGVEICKLVRSKPDIKNIPIIMLTAKGEEEDKIKGLTAGADDYVTKPFSVPELMARVKTNLRRAPEICKLVRSKPDIKNIPIIMLTAKGEEEDKIKGLTAGADDYVTKPFSVPELMARVKTNLRRAPEITPTKELVFEDIRMDLVEKKVFRGENYIHLGPTEFRLLKMLLETPGKVFSRETLLKTVWGDNIYVESRTVDVHIRRLRKSLNDFGPDYIRTVRATGYAIDINPVGDQEEPADN